MSGWLRSIKNKKVPTLSSRNAYDIIVKLKQTITLSTHSPSFSHNQVFGFSGQTSQYFLDSCLSKKDVLSCLKPPKMHMSRIPGSPSVLYRACTTVHHEGTSSPFPDLATGPLMMHPVRGPGART